MEENKKLIDKLQDLFIASYETFKPSIDKAYKITEMYHNRQYTSEQLEILRKLDRVPETFNIIKLFTRQLLGYYSKTFNQITLKPRQIEDIVTASILNDLYSYVNYTNYYHHTFNKIKLSAILSGLMVEYIDVKDSGKRDRFNRPIYNITKEYVPYQEILLDPLSKSEDYSDARFIHRFKWVDKQTLKELFNDVDFSKLTYNYNSTGNPYADITKMLGNNFDITQDDYNEYYLLIHTILKEGDKTYSIYWCNDYILSKKEITYRKVKFPYIVTKLNYSDKAEFYGVFNDVYESQNAINQALLQIQYMINSDKVFVEDNAVEDLEEFEEAYKRISAIIPVNYLAGIKIDKLSTEIQQQYIVIDRAFDRIQRVLGINDSFLGMAFASDSGRKVQLQKQASIIGLQYIDDAFELFSRLDAQVIISLIQQFFRCNQILNIVDEKSGDRWIEINKPMINPITGQPFWEQEIDPDTGKPMYDKYGRPIVTPLPHPDTDIAFTEYDIICSTEIYNDDEQNQLLMEQVINGNAGQMLMTVNPSAYAKLIALSIKNTKTRYSLEVASLFEETAQMLQPQPQNQASLGYNNVGGAINGQGSYNYLTGENNKG